MAMTSKTISPFLGDWTVLRASLHSALGIYDWVLTLGRERQYIWPRKTSKSAILFLIIRYSSLATIPFTIIMSFDIPGKSDLVSAFRVHGAGELVQLVC